MKISANQWTVLGFGLLAMAGLAPAQTLTLKQDGTSVRAEIDGQLFTEYFGSGAQRPYLYPIIGPSGANLARPYPMEKGGAEDHPHHRSFWFAHGAVNGTDFWANGDDHGRQEHVAFEDVKAEGAVGTFTAKTRWVTAAGDEQMTDVRHVRIEALADGEKIVDFNVALTATAGEVVFGDTKEGSFALRIGPTLSMKGEGAAGHMLSSEGIKDKKVWGTRAKWVTAFGPDEKGQEVSITIFDHPGNLRHPTWWHARDYGLFAANPFGTHDFEKLEDKTKGNYTLPKGETLIQRYRVWITRGQPEMAKMNAMFEAFSKQ